VNDFDVTIPDNIPEEWKLDDGGDEGPWVISVPKGTAEPASFRTGSKWLRMADEIVGYMESPFKTRSDILNYLFVTGLERLGMERSVWMNQHSVLMLRMDKETRRREARTAFIDKFDQELDAARRIKDIVTLKTLLGVVRNELDLVQEEGGPEVYLTELRGRETRLMDILEERPI
jgi:hypothetical protein